MNIKEAIHKLEEILEEYGDIEIYGYGHNCQYMFVLNDINITSNIVHGGVGYQEIEYSAELDCDLRY